MLRIRACLAPVFILACSILPSSEAQKLAEGVLKTIPVTQDPRDSYSLPMMLPGANPASYEPNTFSKKFTFERLSEKNVFFNDVYEFEFSFIGGLRQRQFDVPDLSTNTVSKKNCWYIIFRIRDRGDTLTYEQVKENPEFDHLLSKLKKGAEVPADKKYCLPQFYLEGYVISDPKVGYRAVKYHDKILPVVQKQIQQMNDPSLALLDPIAISETQIPLARTDADGGIWGVAIFENVDPKIDFVRLSVEGLSNAYRINTDPTKPNLRKTLQMNFYRPGGVVNEDKDKISFGIPLVDDVEKQVAITQRYHLPGPMLCCYQINSDAGDRRVLVAEVDAEVSLKTFQSSLVPVLEQGKFPKKLAQGLASAGIEVDGLTPEVIINGERWKFNLGEERYEIRLEPQYWNPIIENKEYKIRFIRSLDYFWIYR